MACGQEARSVTPGRSVCERHPHYTPSNMYMKGGGGWEGGRDDGGQESDAESAGATRTASAHTREREERRWNATR